MRTPLLESALEPPLQRLNLRRLVGAIRVVMFVSATFAFVLMPLLLPLILNGRNSNFVASWIAIFVLMIIALSIVAVCSSLDG